MRTTSIVAPATMEIPEPMIDGQVENMLQDTARRMQSQGLNLELYLKYTGMTLDQMKEQMRPQAVKRIETRLVLEEVVKQENIEVSDGGRLPDGVRQAERVHERAG